MSDFQIVRYSKNRKQIMAILSEKNLRSVLSQLENLDSIYFELSSLETETLCVGIEKQYAFVIFMSISNKTQFLSTMNKNNQRCEQIILFNFDSVPMHRPLSRCLPIEDMINILIHYFRHQELSPEFEWDAD